MCRYVLCRQLWRASIAVETSSGSSALVLELQLRQFLVPYHITSGDLAAARTSTELVCSHWVTPVSLTPTPCERVTEYIKRLLRNVILLTYNKITWLQISFADHVIYTYGEFPLMQCHSTEIQVDVPFYNCFALFLSQPVQMGLKQPPLWQYSQFNIYGLCN